MGQKAVTKNYRMMAHKAGGDIGHVDVIANARKRRNFDKDWQKIDTSMLRICEVGKKLNNPDCQATAYRKVKSKFGDKYTCDCCARMIARLNELNWNW